MKKIGLLLVLGAFLFALGSCSKDDDDDFSIVGSWQQVKSELVISTGVPGAPEFTFADEDPVTITFNANGTGSFVDEDGTEAFNWALTGNKLTLTEGNVSQVFTLTTMTENRVVAEAQLNRDELLALFENFDDDDDDDDDDGIDFSMFPNLTAKVVFEMVK